MYKQCYTCCFAATIPIKSSGIWLKLTNLRNWQLSDVCISIEEWFIHSLRLSCLCPPSAFAFPTRGWQQDRQTDECHVQEGNFLCKSLQEELGSLPLNLQQGRTYVVKNLSTSLRKRSSVATMHVCTALEHGKYNNLELYCTARSLNLETGWSCKDRKIVSLELQGQAICW